MFLSDKEYLRDDYYKSIIIDDPKDLPHVPFEKTQISPASVDLRLSGRVWIQKRSFIHKINVSENGSFDFISSRFWKEKTISIKKPLKLKPNETVFGRTHEIIAIPNNCAAKIECKSSIARLSISVTYSDYCNPLYKGHYPLQIHNSGKNTVVLYPNMEICQLMLIKLTDVVELSYNDESRESIYAKYDDGSPTKWWDSNTNKGIRKKLCDISGTIPIDEVLKKIDSKINDDFDDSLVEHNKKLIYRRLRKFLKKKKITSADNTYKEFLKKEKQAHAILDNVIIKGLLLFASAIFGLLPLYFVNRILNILNLDYAPSNIINVIKSTAFTSGQIVNGIIGLIVTLTVIVVSFRLIYIAFGYFSDYAQSHLSDNPKASNSELKTKTNEQD